MKSNISTTIKYIGVDDTDLDLFESQYPIPYGISYNSYLIMDEHVAIMDAVDDSKGEEWMTILEKSLAGRTPAYIIVQHMEPDHSGSILRVVERYPDVCVVATRRAIDMLPHLFGESHPIRHTRVVGDGDRLILGEHTLEFITAPMVHWPEVMCSYDHKERMLFSADAFGTFGALRHKQEWRDEARRYYFNICGKYGMAVQSLLGKVSKFDVKRICPLHGPILDSDISYYIGLYDTWSSYRAESDGVTIAYASIYGGTAAVARRMAEMLREEGARDINTFDLCRDDMSEALASAFRNRHLLLAAASYDGGVFTPMYEFLHRLQTKGFRGRRVAIIENGTWAPAAAKVMCQMLRQLNDIEIVEPVLTILSRMKGADIEQMRSLSKALLRKREAPTTL